MAGQVPGSMLYVSDLVDGLVTLMNSDYDEPVNLGNATRHTAQGDCYSSIYIPYFALKYLQNIIKYNRMNLRTQ